MGLWLREMVVWEGCGWQWGMGLRCMRLMVRGVDILIIPDESDLNVYKTAAKDNSGVGCCGSSESKSSSGCSGRGEVKKGEASDIDLNEWAGTQCIITKGFESRK